MSLSKVGKMTDYTVFSLLFYFLSCLVVGSLGLFSSFLLYLHYLHKINEHLPGPPRSSFIFGHIPKIREYRQSGRTMSEYILHKRLEYGPIFSLFFLHRTAVVFGDATYVKEVFIDSQKYLHKEKFHYDKMAFIFGERVIGYGLVSNTDVDSWRKRRRLMNPAFHRKCLKNFMNDFNQVCDRFLERMNHVVENAEETSMLKEFGNVTLDIMSQVSFNINVGAIEHPESQFPLAITSVFKGMQACLKIPVSSFLLSIFQFKLFQTAEQKEQIDAAKFLRKFAFECITDRIKDIEANKPVPDDLLNILVNDKTLSMDDIIDEFITIFVAGQESTANFLAFTLYEIIRHPDVEAKILDEINEVLGSKEYVDFEDLGKLKYLGQVLQESLRMHPPVGGPVRELQKELTVGGYRLPKGNVVVGATYMCDYNPDFWTDPELFDPERFSAPENIPNFSTLYFPFSVGPRNCIGQTVAKFESKVILARILREFQFKLLPGQTAKIEERLTFPPRDGVVCEVKKR